MRRVQGRDADMELVGVFEPDAALRKAFRERYGIAEDKMFASLDDLLQRAKPEAVAAFSSTRDHRPIIEAARRARRPRDGGEAAGGVGQGRPRHRGGRRRRAAST